MRRMVTIVNGDTCR